MAKRDVAPLEGRGLRLRLLEEADLTLTRSWRNRDDVRHHFFHSDLIAAGDHAEWYDRYIQKDDDFLFVIEETAKLRRPIGQVSVYNVDWLARRGEFGRLMIGDPEARGRGLARSATRTLLQWALGALGLEEVYLQVFEGNAPALAVYRASGFVETGREGGVVRMARRR